MSSYVERIHAAVRFIEEHLGDPLTVADVARRASFSPFHFHRVFTGMVGETVMEYVRRRRLSLAADRLLASDRPIIDVALDVGFESQEAFTRAFKRRHGVTPGRYRREGRLSPHRREPVTLVDLETGEGGRVMQPRFVDVPEFHVVGMAERFTPETTDRIKDLWGRFVARMGEVGHVVPDCAYGVCYDEAPAGGEEQPPFLYMAALPVERIEEVPDGMEARTFPASRCAVFTVTDGLAGLQESFRHIFGVWLPASGYAQAGPDIERYDERFDPETGNGEIDIYVPVIPA